MKTLHTLFLILCVQICVAQKFSVELQSLINAENNFARYSKEHNMRDAFLANLTDSTVLFTKDGPTKGKQSWSERKPNNNLLFWWPLFVGLSNNNDMGFSTGPSQWSESKDAQHVAHGYFVSVWQKVNGKWKLAADIGSPMPGPETDAVLLHASNPKGSGEKGGTIERSFLSLDKAYSEEINKASVFYMPDYYSKDAMLKHPSKFPDYFPFGGGQTLLTKPHYKTLGGDMATSNDLAYAYGTVSATINESGSATPFTANFLRVWKFEDNAWKIIVDVISGPQ